MNAAGTRAVVVLGASNVSRGLARLSAIVRARAPAPVSLFVAAGHGRGYGVNTRVAWRRLPSILGCGLWRALDRERIERPMVVVTDVGNELLYGLGVSAVAGAVREATHRLATRGGRLVITGLPLAAVAGVGAVRYRLLRMLYVPRCLLGLDELKEATCWLDEELQALAVETGATFIEQPADWYGLDALHVRRPHLDALWQRVCDAWGLPCTTASPRATWRDWAAIGSRGAEVRSLARTVRFTPQPVVERSGLRVWMY
ncbi:MAG: hypothetical protein DWI03_04350 [Planctomycetota bacterium]|nr:MAG: hypothetical protein DWI03_04350 [Planctomycetota bacterium]